MIPKLFEKTDKPYPGDITYLTSTRFFAALSIVIFHFIYEQPWVKLDEGVWGRLYLGVDFFFILSGFILTHAYITSIEKGTFSPLDFIVKRFARIYPVHLITLLMSAGVSMFTIIKWGVVFDGGDTPACFLRNLFMLNAWGLSAQSLCFNDPSWSISAEWFAYLLFPILAGFALKWKGLRTLIVATLLMLGLYGLYGCIMGAPLTNATKFGIIRILPDFTIGIGLYLTGRIYSLKCVGSIFSGTLFAALILSLAMNASDIVAVFFFAAIIYVIAEQARQEKKSLLGNKHLVYWGEASYSIYMLHYVFYEMILLPVATDLETGTKSFDSIKFWVAWGICWVLVFVSAHLMYKYVEFPARRAIVKKFATHKNAKS